MSASESKELLRAARALTGLTQARICELAGIPLITLRRIEGKPDHTGLVSTETVQNRVRVYESLGVQFLEKAEPASGPGVALRQGGQA